LGDYPKEWQYGDPAHFTAWRFLRRFMGDVDAGGFEPNDFDDLL